MFNANLKKLGFKVLDWDDESQDHTAINEHNEQVYVEIDAKAKAQGSLLGRCVETGVADGCSHYLITKVNAKTVQLTFVYIWDGYSDRAWGRGTCNESREYIESMIEMEDSWDKIVADTKKRQAKEKKVKV